MSAAAVPRAGSSPARWPWLLVGVAVTAALAALVLVPLNGGSLLSNSTNFLAFMGMGVVGALIASRDPSNRIGLLLISISVGTAIAFSSGEAAVYLAEHGSRSVARWLAWPGNVLWVVAIFPLLTLLPLLFPDGRLASPRWRLPMWGSVAVTAVSFVAEAFGRRSYFGGVDASSDTIHLANPFHVPALRPLVPIGESGWLVILAFFLLAVVAMILRFRRARGVERQQLKWFAFAAIVLVLFEITTLILDALGFNPGVVSDVLSGLVFLGFPVAVGIAVLQYRLWDLDVVARKTVVAGTLVVLVAVVYAIVVAVFGVVATGRESTGVLFVLALALGIAFRPVIRAARRFADRIVYGRRATPYEVLTEFSERVGTSYATEDVLHRMAQVLGEGTGAEVARIWLLVGGEFRPEAAWPADAPPVAPVAPVASRIEVAGETVVEVRDKGDLLGALSVRMPVSDPMGPSKERLVRDLAAQAGLVLRNVGLVEDLRASRQRLVAAQDQERRRLERNIHDGAQQQLVALAVKARLASQLVERDAEKAADLLGQIESETQSALEDLRDLARGIYPPLLADRGLVAAIEAQSRKSHLEVEVEAAGLGRYPADVEATVYFCTLEALQNVAKYAAAERTVIRLARSNGTVSFEVVDDGRGFDPSAITAGSGLQGMADRLAAVGGSLEIRSAPGGGTTVAGHVPVTE